MTTRKLILLLTLAPTLLFAQTENCTNGIDDDGDGLIDCFDTECGCTGPCADYYYNTCPTSCFYQPPCDTITLGVDWVGNAETGTYGTLVAGDLDRDGVPEVVTYNCEGTQLYIINGATGQTKVTITSPSYFPGGTSPAIADLDGDGFGEIVIVSDDRRMRCYNHLGTLKWTTTNEVGHDYTYRFCSPSIADFDHSGTAEICIGNEIYSGQTGALLASGGPTLSAGEHPVRKSGGFSFNASVPMDVLPDGFCVDCQGLEIVAGNMVLSVDLVAGTIKKVTQAPAGYSDGFTSVVDINKDGTLDAIVQGRKNGWNTVYGWNTKTGTIIGEYKLLNNWTEGASRVNIADMNDDQQLEMNFISYPQMYTLRSNFSVLWIKQNDDVSAVTSSSVFDFCGDGSADIIYRGQSKLQILEGATGVVKWEDGCTSATHIECPLILDVDADGQTEVVITCGAGPNGSGRVTCYETINTPGIPSRKVWNQHAYFSTNIEEDLRVPRYQQNPHLIADGVKMNGFLNQYFNPTFPAPDGSIDIQSVTCVGDSIALRVEVCNSGQNVLPATTPVSFYTSNPQVAGATWFYTTAFGKLLRPDSCTMVTLTLPRRANVQVYAVLNDNASLPVPFNLDQQFPVTTIGECNFMNNLDSFLLDYAPKTLALGKDSVICDNATVSFDVSDTYTTTYLWQNGSALPTFTAPDAGTFTIQTNDVCGIMQRDTIVIRVDSATVVQLGANRVVCKSENFTLTAPGFDTYIWTPVAATSCQNCPSPTITPFATGPVALRAALSNGCWSTDTIQVVVHDTTYQIIDTTICYGLELNTNNTQIQPDSTKLFALQSQYGCDSTVVYRVKGTFLGTYQTQIDTAVCKGKSLVYAGVTLSDNQSYQFDLSARSGCDSTVTLRTSPLDTFLTTESQRICAGDIAQIFGAAQTTSGIYTKLFTAANGCDSTHYVSLIVTPAVVLSAESDQTCPLESNGGIRIAASGGTPPFLYQWDDPTLQGTNLKDLGAGNYLLTVTDQLNCSAILTTAVTPYPDFDWLATATDPLCHNQTNGLVLFQSADKTLLYSFDNRPFGFADTITGLAAATYTVQAQDTYGCIESQTVSLTNPPKLQISFNPTALIALGDSIELEAIPNTTDALTYQWTPPLYLSCPDCPNPMTKPLYAVRYTVLATNQNGCTATTQHLVDVDRTPTHFAPNAFAPASKDFANAGFMPFFGIAVDQVLSFSVYDRWGNIQYLTKDKSREDPDMQWDGRSNGKAVIPGVYVWTAQVKLVDGSSQWLHGDVAVVR
jgi:FG-GAP-like repeat